MGKATGSSQKITITNDKGRLTKEDIERMVGEAERFKEDDEKQAARISAKNQLESYCYQIKNTVEGQAVKSKLSEGDIKSVEDAVAERLSWLDANQAAEKDEYEHVQNELEQAINPILAKLHAPGVAGTSTQSESQPR